MTQRKNYLLRISPTLFRELEQWAEQELRSVNGQIEFVLTEAVRRRKREAGRTDDPRTGRQ